MGLRLGLRPKSIPKKIVPTFYRQAYPLIQICAWCRGCGRFDPKESCSNKTDCKRCHGQYIGPYHHIICQDPKDIPTDFG